MSFESVIHPAERSKPTATFILSDLELSNLIQLLRDVLKQRQDEAAFKESQVAEFLETKLLFSKREAAAALSISVVTLEQHIAAKHIKARRIGGRVLISRQELLRCRSDADALPKLREP